MNDEKMVKPINKELTLIGRANTLLARAKELGLTKEQKHLDKNTIEREYWHYGYAIALMDVYKNFRLTEIKEIYK